MLLISMFKYFSSCADGKRYPIKMETHTPPHPQPTSRVYSIPSSSTLAAGDVRQTQNKPQRQCGGFLPTEDDSHSTSTHDYPPAPTLDFVAQSCHQRVSTRENERKSICF